MDGLKVATSGQFFMPKHVFPRLQHPNDAEAVVGCSEFHSDPV